ncbi:hypothetical protein PspS35_14715 [Pseudomonas sp. S35]|uniref:DUF2523 domain-containing protein n=1 Tax=Pseudomonas sp. S35 TaxID=1573719 RepID=UPI00132EE7D5|nr:DUF2523 domain-containing protein [Pseudomonas sp. S35]QHF44945.1 hypothetical protein PspS35_14585 [Pseudomonas sp. S35]QHF44958.1 hypothetical protein PspS35_14650 [Pseudomonas sp. S35]QHF44971.1 hypothetical protein PspS35_14715 [Pseudomonas sp. S35]
MSAFGDWLLSILREILQFFVDLIIQVADWLWQSLLELISSSFIMGLLTSSGELFTNISPSVWYFMNLMQLPFGITVVSSAYLLRFLVRRIPFIG